MPFTFPCHPGLVLPLWVGRPDVFDALALTVAAVLPDLLDLAIELPTGDRDQNFAHSLLGLVTAVIPLSFGLVYLYDLFGSRRLRRFRDAVAVSGLGAPGSPTRRRALWLRRLTVLRFRWGRVLVSVAIGGFSHLVFDAITHPRFDWLLPWARPKIRPESVEGHWLEVWIRGIDLSFGVGLFGLMWLAWSALGALLFVWSLWAARSRASWR
ncbi:MAG: DUF4184 family protein [Gemmatimonadota bacterium]